MVILKGLAREKTLPPTKVNPGIAELMVGMAENRVWGRASVYLG
jgi:hypothetical protein